MRRRVAVLGLVGSLVAGCFLFDDPPDPTGTGTGTTVATGETMTPTTGYGTAGECNVAEDCPPAAMECQGASCFGGACLYDYLPEGTPWPYDEYGDCYLEFCDGAGGVYSEPGDDPPLQKSGDCHRFMCDAGNIVSNIDDSDLPDDANDCTLDECMMGEASNTVVPEGSVCGELDNNYCHSDGQCHRCKEVTAMCEDFGGEPHEDQQTAFNLGAIDDNDANGSYVCGTLRGANDIDWYTFDGNDALGNKVDPVRSLVTQNGENGRVCVFFECAKGSTTVDCKAATPTMSPLGHKGCCAGATVAPKLNCGGLDDTTRVWIRVDNPNKLACVPYELDYHF